MRNVPDVQAQLRLGFRISGRTRNDWQNYVPVPAWVRPDIRDSVAPVLTRQDGGVSISPVRNCLTMIAYYDELDFHTEWLFRQGFTEAERYVSALMQHEAARSAVRVQGSTHSGAGVGTAGAGMIRFQLGRLLVTPGALEAMKASGDHPGIYIARHATGNWGDLSAHDLKANEDALRLGGRLLSAYHLSDGMKVWLITEADRSATTIILPSEY